MLKRKITADSKTILKRADMKLKPIREVGKRFADAGRRSFEVPAKLRKLG